MPIPSRTPPDAAAVLGFVDLGFAKVDIERRARVLIVAAGLEAALPSVVAGLVSRPVIGLPTGVGYGTSIHGLTAVLGMLNSCGSGVMVVNMDNGFGAAFAAAQICRLADEERSAAFQLQPPLTATIAEQTKAAASAAANDPHATTD